MFVKELDIIKSERDQFYIISDGANQVEVHKQMSLEFILNKLK